MKIAFLYDSIAPFNMGGKEQRLYDLTHNLSNLGMNVHIYTMKFWEGSKIRKQGNVVLHAITGMPMRLYNKKIRSIKQGVYFGFSSFKMLKEDFDVIDADHMVYFHLFPAKLACIIKRKPLIITWNEVWSKEHWIKYMGKIGYVGYLIEKISSKLPNKIISISEHTTKKLVNNLHVPKRKIFTIPNWIDASHIAKVKHSKEKSDIIFAGRLLFHKNVDLLIKSIKVIKGKHHKIKCFIIGDGPEKEYLQTIVESFNLRKNIIFKGFIQNHDEVLSLVKSSKVFVLPSSREGFGIAAIEANACGIPVVTINHEDNAAKNLIKNGKNGYVSEMNELKLANTIVKALKNHKKMKISSINFARKYDWNNIFNKFLEVYGK